MLQSLIIKVRRKGSYINDDDGGPFQRYKQQSKLDVEEEEELYSCTPSSLFSIMLPSICMYATRGSLIQITNRPALL